MERRQFTFILIAVLVVLFIWNPFSRKRDQKVPPPRVTREEAQAMADYMENSTVPPEEYLAGMFRDRDVVFIGEGTKIKEHVEFIRDVIPYLYDAGVRNLGMEHVLADDQSAVDRLLTSLYFDEQNARELLRRRYAMWGFQEYIGIFEAAWELNAELSEDQRPFRIVGLAVRHDWTVLETEKQLKDPEIKRRILTYGLPSTFMADTIQREIMEPGEKALVFCSLAQSFTRYRNKQYEESAREEGYEEVRGAGNIIHDRIGSRAATAYLHLFWPDTKSQYGVAFAVGGIIDAALSLLPEDQRRAGFDTRGNPASDTPIKEGIYAYEYEDLTMKDIYDGYLVFGPLHEYRPATPIPDFFTPENVEETLVNFPAPKERLPAIEKLETQEDLERAAEELNSLLDGEAQNTTRFLQMFDYT